MVQEKFFKLLNCYFDDQELPNPELYKPYVEPIMEMATVQDLKLYMVDALIKYDLIEQKDMKLMSMLITMKHLSENQEKIRLLFDILGELEASDIQYQILKGFEMSRCYQQPEYRVMSDCDILIDPMDIVKVDKIFNSYGYRNSRLDNYEYDDAYVHENGLLIELHFALTKKEHIYTGEWFLDEFKKSVVRNSISYGNQSYEFYTAAPTVHMTFLFAHLSKHILHQGYSMKQLLDIVMYARRESIDWQVVDDQVRRLNIAKSSAYIIALMRKCFHYEVSILGDIPIDEEVLDELLTMSFSHMKAERIKVERFNDSIIKRYGLDSDGSPISQWIAILFPNRKHINWRYAYAKKYVVLLPLAWFHRFLYEITVQHRRVIEFMRADRDYEAIRRQQKLMKALGFGNQ